MIGKHKHNSYSKRYISVHTTYWHTHVPLFLLAGADYAPAPDLDHTNPELRAALKDWLGWLARDVGFGGWRLDFVKGWGGSGVHAGLLGARVADGSLVGGQVRSGRRGREGERGRQRQWGKEGRGRLMRQAGGHQNAGWEL